MLVAGKNSSSSGSKAGESGGASNMKLSRTFLIELKLNELPAYRIAQQAGVNPNTLSKLVSGILPVKADDERILRVANVLGLKKDEVFEVME